MPYVDVQHPEQGEWTRYFKTDDEAERYKEHMINDRKLIAQIRRSPPPAEQLLLQRAGQRGRHC